MEERYERQLIMPEFNLEIQKKISNTTVAVVGCGGLGSPNIYYLSSLGIGKLILIDGDVIEKSNLNRQILYNEENIGRLKAELAAERVHEYNAGVKVDYYAEYLTRNNSNKILKDADIIVDAVDNLKTRYLLDEYSEQHNVPVFFAAVEGFKGTIYEKLKKSAPRYSDIYPKFKKENNCPIGIVGANAGLVGCYQCLEVIKYIIGVNNNSKLISMENKRNKFSIMEM